MMASTLALRIDLVFSAIALEALGSKMVIPAETSRPMMIMTMDSSIRLNPFCLLTFCNPCVPGVVMARASMKNFCGVSCRWDGGKPVVSMLFGFNR